MGLMTAAKQPRPPLLQVLYMLAQVQASCFGPETFASHGTGQAKRRVGIKDVRESRHWAQARSVLQDAQVSQGGPVRPGLQLLHTCVPLGGTQVLPRHGRASAVHCGNVAGS